MLEGYEKDVKELCKKMIQQRSYSGEEKGVVACIEEEMKKQGFHDVTVDGYGNVIGCIKGKRPGKKILFDGHIDTVVVEDESKWTVPPFEGLERDGKIYGRGASDMKGQLSAMITAAGHFARDTKGDFAGEIYVAGVVFEEVFEGISARAISSAIQPDCVVIGESTELNLNVGQRGRAEIVLQTAGKPAHSANPDKGINAVYKMMEVVQQIRELPCSEHPVLGKGILVLTDIKSSPYPGSSVVPDGCRATFDRRLLVGETPESVLAPLQELLTQLQKNDPELCATVSYARDTLKCFTGNTIEGERFFPGWLYTEDEPFVQGALKGLKKAGLNPTVSCYSFCTNGSHYAGEANIPTIGFGPSRENLAHTIDEYIEVEQLVKGVQGYYGILQSVCGCL